jgi:hypothetical protein
MKKAVALNPLWNNLKAYYTADSTPNDALGVYNGTLTNGATYATGKINNGFSLDGTNDYISLPNAMFTPSGSYSISQWINFPSVGTFAIKPIFVVGSTLTTNSIVIYLYNDGSSTFIRFLNSNNSTYQILDYILPSFNVFYHIVCVKDTVSNKYYVYVNGSLAIQSAIGVNYVSNNTTVRLGNLSSWYYTGIIDEVALWDSKALTSSEVTQLYNSGNGKQYPN